MVFTFPFNKKISRSPPRLLTSGNDHKGGKPIKKVSLFDFIFCLNILILAPELFKSKCLNLLGKAGQILSKAFILGIQLLWSKFG